MLGLLPSPFIVQDQLSICPPGNAPKYLFLADRQILLVQHFHLLFWHCFFHQESKIALLSCPASHDLCVPVFITGRFLFKESVSMAVPQLSAIEPPDLLVKWNKPFHSSEILNKYCLSQNLLSCCKFLMKSEPVSV